MQLAEICMYTNTLYITIKVMFFDCLPTRVSLLSSKVHNGDDTAKDKVPDKSCG